MQLIEVHTGAPRGSNTCIHHPFDTFAFPCVHYSARHDGPFENTTSVFLLVPRGKFVMQRGHGRSKRTD